MRVGAVHRGRLVSGQLHPDLLTHTGIGQHAVERMAQGVERQSGEALGPALDVLGINARLLHQPNELGRQSITATGTPSRQRGHEVFLRLVACNGLQMFSQLGRKRQDKALASLVLEEGDGAGSLRAEVHIGPTEGHHIP